jgi:hypothetical protein
MIAVAGKPDLRPHSRRLWSLWELMDNFRFGEIRLFLQEIDILIGVSGQNLRADRSLIDEDREKQILDKFRRDVRRLVTDTHKLFEYLRCIHITAAAAKLARWAERKDIEWHELNTRARLLKDAIVNELREYLYYQYPKEKGKKLVMWELEWRAVVRAFPGVKNDVLSAVDCYALQQGTACVFHCMRVLERGFGALADEVGLVFDIQQWKTIIDQIEKKIRELRGTLPRSVAKDETMQRLSEAAKEFYYFKDGWRNYVSHGRATYDEHQAAIILEHTRVFMTVLSSQIGD